MGGELKIKKKRGGSRRGVVIQITRTVIRLFWSGYAPSYTVLTGQIYQRFLLNVFIIHH